MKIELTGGWIASCEIEIKVNGYTLGAFWSTDEGYRILDWGDSEFSEDEQEELEKRLERANTPTLGFKDGSDVLEISDEN